MRAAVLHNCALTLLTGSVLVHGRPGASDARAFASPDAPGAILVGRA